MYAKDTILKLKEQREPDKGVEFPYNRVRVVGESPVSHGGTTEWSGRAASGVIIEPIASFGGNLDEPFGKLQQLYDVESLPEAREADIQPKIRVVNSATAEAGPTPEEVFAAAAPGEPSPRAKRAAKSPLGDPKPPSSDPLDKNVTSAD